MKTLIPQREHFNGAELLSPGWTLTGYVTQGGAVLGDTDYRIDYSRNFIVIGHTGEELAGTWAIDIELVDPGFDTLPLFMSNAEVVLHLEDARRTATGRMNGKTRFVHSGGITPWEEPSGQSGGA